MYVMKWSDRDSCYNDPSKHGLWVGIDDNSGGYPYATDYFNGAEIFTTLEQAKDYQSKFPCLDIYELAIQAKLV